MITISLNEIRAQSPCLDGWEKVLESKGGTSADMYAQFPLTDVLESNDLNDTLWCLRCLPVHVMLWGKYAVWCARQVQHLTADQRSIAALDVVWRHSEGLATDEELDAARDAAWDAAWAAAGAVGDAAGDAAWAAAWAAAGAAAGDAAGAAWAARDDQKAKLIEILTAGEWVE